MSTTDLRIVKTKAKLREALKDMMQEIPFDQITVNDLCTRAKIRRATFYKHFADKYDFLASVVSLLQSEISEKLERLEKCDNHIEYYTLYLKEILDYLRSKHQLVNLIISSEAFPEILTVILRGTLSSLNRDLAKDKQNGISLPASVEATASFINGGLSTIVGDWLRAESPDDDALLSDAKSFLARLLPRE